VSVWESVCVRVCVCVLLKGILFLDLMVLWCRRGSLCVCVGVCVLVYC